MMTIHSPTHTYKHMYQRAYVRKLPRMRVMRMEFSHQAYSYILDEQVFVPSAVCVRDHVFCVCIGPYLSVYVIIHSALTIRNSLALILHDIFAFKLTCGIVLNSIWLTTSNGFWSVRLVQQFSVYAFYTHTQTRRCASKCLLNMKILVRTAYKTISETTHRHIRTHTFRFHIHMNETACMAAS